MLENAIEISDTPQTVQVITPTAQASLDVPLEVQCGTTWLEIWAGYLVW